MSSVRRLFLRLALGAVMLVPAAAKAQTFQTLYSFAGSPDGRFPSGVVFDTNGNLYGTTLYDGNSTACGDQGCGTVFKLAPPAEGQTAWTESLYPFTGSPDGADPNAGLVLMNGALYGTTAYGGYANDTTCQGGCGTVFELDPTTQALITLYTFTGVSFSGGPYAGLVFGAKGALYGTTEGGDGASPIYSEVFKLTPPGWTFATLHTFPHIDGEASEVVFDKAGNLYGATSSGGGGGSSVCGRDECGTVFKLNPVSRTLTTLHAFTGGADGGTPKRGLTINYLANGTFVLYGVTTAGGGKSKAGTVFELNPTTKALTTLHAFAGGADGGTPSGLAFNGGSLYGTTLFGGNTSDCSSFGGCGVVFRLAPPAKGHAAWTETVLHTFAGGADGGGPLGRLVFDTKGALYGTTVIGGDNTACSDNSGFLDVPTDAPPGCGVVFKLTP